MIAIGGIIITEKMRKAGEDITSDAMDVHCRKHLGGSNLGGCKPLNWDEFPNNTDLLRKYSDDELDTVQMIY
ncbi:MAG: hypothetical protein KAS32_29535, partial [Candidatus Peribacteraceae bacterium]|nr:hypothetical protein [Candidatus Peribacteraceae bacterium]